MNIDIRENPQEIYSKSEPPFDSVFTGKDTGADGIGIYIRQSILLCIDNYLSEDKSNELGGVLVGDVCESESGEKFVLIENMILAMHANSSLSRLTFTHDTWDYINKVLEEDHPGKRIVGWFHSHPGHTVFMSGHDLFIHENFFNLPYMVAYVFDPTIRERGFYKWSGSEIVRSGGFYIYDNEGGERIHEILNTDKDETVSKDAKSKSKIKSGRIDILKSILIALSLFSFLLTAFLAYKFIELNKQLLALNDLREEVEVLRTKVDAMNMNQELSSEKGQTSKKNVSASEETEKKISKENPVTSGLNENKPVAETVSDKEIPKQNEKQSAPVTDAVSQKYTVKKGDTIERISISFYGSRDGIKRIMDHNRIKSVTSIREGQILEIPVRQ